MNITILNISLNQEELEQRLISIIDSNQLHNINYVNALVGQSNWVKNIADQLFVPYVDEYSLLDNTDLLITFGKSDIILRLINKAKTKHIKVISDLEQSNGFKPSEPEIKIILGTVWDKPDEECFETYIGRWYGDLNNCIVNNRPFHYSGLGNPFTVEDYGRECAIELFSVLFKHQTDTLQHKARLLLEEAKKQGKSKIKLCCYCKNKDCHGRIIKEYLESL